MRVTVTGAYGFIGSHVCRELVSKGHDVVGIDSCTYAADPARVKDLDMIVHQMDICDQEMLQDLLKTSGTEVIVNTAAETHVDNSIVSSSKFVKSNVDGVRSILDACRITGTSLLHFSTDEVYGVPLDSAFTEESGLNPRNPYSATKAAADLLIRSYEVTHGFKTLTLRPSNNFGTGQHSEKFIPTIIRSLRSGKGVPVYGDGMQEREWTSVKDTARAVEFLLRDFERNAGQIFNLSSGASMTNLKIVEKIVSVLFPGEDYRKYLNWVNDRPGHDRKYWISSSKIVNLGFVFEEEFEETVEDVCNSV